MNSKTIEQELAKKIACMDDKSFSNFITRCCIMYNKCHRDKVTDYAINCFSEKDESRGKQPLL